MEAERVLNFGAGPSALPASVLQESAKGLWNFEGTGIGVAEISHRSKEFVSYITKVESRIRTLLDVPHTHTILFTQGGGTAQFSAVVLNLLARHRLLYPNLSDDEHVLDYVVTGSWSKKAAEEAARLGGSRINIVVDARQHSKDQKSFDNIPSHDSYTFSSEPALIYYCENETVDGVQFSDDPGSPASFPFASLKSAHLPPLVGDYSSSFMSRPIPRLADHAIIYAGAQKNVGPAGLTILIVRNDCIVDVDAAAKLGAAPIPISMSYKTLADSKSLYNTPPVLSIYITGLVMEDISRNGGIVKYAKMTKEKAAKVYEALREGEDRGILREKVKKGSGSLMNIVFDVVGDGLEAKFIGGAETRGMKGLKGHRSVGGIRVSLYNAVTVANVDKLATYMREFIKENGTA